MSVCLSLSAMHDMLIVEGEKPLSAKLSWCWGAPTLRLMSSLGTWCAAVWRPATGWSAGGPRRCCGCCYRPGRRVEPWRQQQALRPRWQVLRRCADVRMPVWACQRWRCTVAAG